MNNFVARSETLRFCTTAVCWMAVCWIAVLFVAATAAADEPAKVKKAGGVTISHLRFGPEPDCGETFTPSGSSIS